MNKKFQSLFYWKYHFNSVLHLPQYKVLYSFNPCFTGSTTSTQRLLQQLQVKIAVSILVLLEVPLQLISQVEFGGLLPRFNPCFTGSTTSTPS